MSRPLLSVENCKVRYGAVNALNGMTMHVDAASVVGLVGPLGAGKTTLLRMIAGLVQPDHGNLEFDGRSLRHLAPDERARRGIIHVPADGGFFPSLTVRENLMLAQRDSSFDHIRDWLTTEFAVLGERQKQRAGTLSGGEQRQLAIVRGALGGPRLLLLDEPLLGLSPVSSERVIRLLRWLHSGGVTVIVVEERPTEVLRGFVDSLVGLRAGRVVPVADVERSDAAASTGAQGALHNVDVEMLGIPMSTRDKRALQTIADSSGQSVGELIAWLVHEYADQHQEIWR
jgi:branched-chain amino acid transport system ATP-binding protein